MMSWENCPQDEAETKVIVNFKLIHDKNEKKQLLQLRRLQDPTKDERRKFYIDTANRFGELLVNSKEEVAQTLLTEDCEAFLFNFAEIASVNYVTRSDEFINLYKEAQVVKREVKDVFVDSERTTAFQICYCEMIKEEDGSLMPQFSFEAFSFIGDKISKYRASYGCSTIYDELHHPFEASRKDKMLAKVKELNYAWAGKPDLKRIASLLHESTEYKFWRWKDHKPFVFSKLDFSLNFRNLEENYIVKCVVPYEVYSEGQYILGTYVYHLEGLTQLAGKRFLWISSCIYKFNKDLNIEKISQQGELHPEDEIEIPFEVYSRDKLTRVILEDELKKSCDKEERPMTERFLFSFEACLFSPTNFGIPDVLRGFNDSFKLKDLAKNYKFDGFKIVDIFFDDYDPSYDVIILYECLEGNVKRDGYKYSGMDLSFCSIRKLSFEKGRVAKMIAFTSQVHEPIPSPYDNPNFSNQHIKPKEDNLSN